MADGQDRPPAVCDCLSEGTVNSRKDRDAAGWGRDWNEKAMSQPEWRKLLARRRRARWGNFRWISVAPLLASMNDVLAKGLDDLVTARRPRWTAAQRAAGRGKEGLFIKDCNETENLSFLVLGDTGESDPSQYAVVHPLLERGRGSDFMVIASDVIYPAGDINDYVDGFYLPYERYPAPIYALPGNHDWYDGLNGFMFHFCGAEALPPIAYRAGSYSWNERIARLLWRKPSPPDRALLEYCRSTRAESIRRAAARRGRRPPTTQPGPYFAIETPDLLIVCIDTGITGVLDREQGEWLCSMSRSDQRAKVLITGKPLYVDGEYRPGQIDWGPTDDKEIVAGSNGYRTVDDIVRNPAHNYVAAIGGDIHNYQRYSVSVYDTDPERHDNRRPRRGAARSIEYIVAGGGGAFLSATHPIDKVALIPRSAEDDEGEQDELPPKFRPGEVPHTVDRVGEDAFRCYPLRGDSLALFVRHFGRIAFGFLVTSLSLVALGTGAYFLWPLDGIGSRIDHPALADRPAWWTVVAVPLLIVVAVLIVVGAAKVGSSLAPRRYRTFTAAAGTVVLLAAVFLVLDPFLKNDWDWLWKTAVAILLIGLSLLLFAVYEFFRDFVPQFVRTAFAPAALVAAGAIWLAGDATGPTDIVLLAGGSVVVLVGLTLVLAALEDVGDRPAKRPWRRKVAWALSAFALLAVVVLVLLQLSDSSWVPIGFVWVVASVLFWLAAVVLGLGYLGLTVLPGLYRSDIDPDRAVSYIAEQLEAVRSRQASADADVLTLRRLVGVVLKASGISGRWRELLQSYPKWRDRRLARFVYRLPFIQEKVSELAEASRPPFFKSFLRITLKGPRLRIECWGVTGWVAHESSPALEDCVEISLKRTDELLQELDRTARQQEGPP